MNNNGLSARIGPAPFRLAILFVSLLLAAVLSSCSRGYSYEDGPYSIWLESENDSLHVLHLSVDGVKADTLLIPYPVYQFDCGDLTGNGCPEICVGVIKATRYWPRGKRLFVYHLYHGRHIRPLWLGSKLGDIETFRVERDSVPARLITDQAQYRYQGFGFKFEHYLH